MSLVLYDNIRRRRKELGMTQSELARRMNYADKSMIAKIEKGLVDLPQSKIKAFAGALQTTAADLMGWSVSEENVVRIPLCTGFVDGVPVLSPDAYEMSHNIAHSLRADFIIVQPDRLRGPQSVYVQRHEELEDGIPFVFYYNNEVLLKRAYRYANGELLLLRHLEAGEPDLEVPAAARDKLHVIGKIVALRRRIE